MTDWITGVLESMGYAGIALLMFAENLFPPIPSELIMPFAGFAAARGDLNPVGVLTAGTIGALLGALPWYYAGRTLGCQRVANWADKHGRWLTLSRDEVYGANKWFARHCGKAVLVGRLVPAVRTLISLPAGIAEMSIPRFLVYSAIGSVAWNAALVALGYKLGSSYSKVAEYMDPVSKGVLALIVIVYLYRVIRGNRARGEPRTPRDGTHG
jgi:membrane protein DedA with SNARE-associated domain